LNINAVTRFAYSEMGGLQTSLGPARVRWCWDALRAVGAHLVARHCAVQQVRCSFSLIYNATSWHIEVMTKQQSTWPTDQFTEQPNKLKSLTGWETYYTNERDLRFSHRCCWRFKPFGPLRCVEW